MLGARTALNNKHKYIYKMQIYYIDTQSESLDSFLDNGWSLLSIQTNGIALLSKAGLLEPFSVRKGDK